jgi:ketosteroid isomerase-like protein
MALTTLDRQELDRFARAFEDLFYQGDAAAMAAFYAADAEVMAPDTDVVRGPHAIEAFFTAASAAAQRLGMRRTIHVRRVERSGDLGYVLSTVVLELPAADAQAITTTFNDVTVWKLDTNQGWRIVVDSANRTAPPQPRRPV